jgi:hypothetical protein
MMAEQPVELPRIDGIAPDDDGCACSALEIFRYSCGLAPRVERLTWAILSGVIGDVDADGVPDLVYWGRGPRVVLGGPGPAFEERQIRFSGTCSVIIGLADVDEDGAVDIVCVGAEEPSHAARIDVMLADGAGGFESRSAWRPMRTARGSRTRRT